MSDSSEHDDKIFEWFLYQANFLKKNEKLSDFANYTEDYKRYIIKNAINSAHSYRSNKTNIDKLYDFLTNDTNKEMFNEVINEMLSQEVHAYYDYDNRHITDWKESIKATDNNYEVLRHLKFSVENTDTDTDTDDYNNPYPDSIKKIFLDKFIKEQGLGETLEKAEKQAELQEAKKRLINHKSERHSLYRSTTQNDHMKKINVLAEKAWNNLNTLYQEQIEPLKESKDEINEAQKNEMNKTIIFFNKMNAFAEKSKKFNMFLYKLEHEISKKNLNAIERQADHLITAIKNLENAIPANITAVDTSSIEDKEAKTAADISNNTTPTAVTNLKEQLQKLKTEVNEIKEGASKAKNKLKQFKKDSKAKRPVKSFFKNRAKKFAWAAAGVLCLGAAVGAAIGIAMAWPGILAAGGVIAATKAGFMGGIIGGSLIGGAAAGVIFGAGTRSEGGAILGSGIGMAAGGYLGGLAVSKLALVATGAVALPLVLLAGAGTCAYQAYKTPINENKADIDKAVTTLKDYNQKQNPETKNSPTNPSI